MSNSKHDSLSACEENQISVETRVELEPESSSPGKDAKTSRSTGPRTEHGKRRSSKNAIKHGFFCHEEFHLHLDKKDRKSFLKVFKGLLKDWDPIGQSELIQVELMALHLQQQKRIMRLRTAQRSNEPVFALLDAFSSATRDMTNVARWLQDMPPLEDLERIQRYENHVLKNYYQARAELLRLQKSRLGDKYIAANGGRSYE